MGHATMTIRDDATHRPPPLMMLLETRAFAEFGAFVSTYPLLRRAPRGDGHPVLVLPGLSASDASTWPLRAYLRDLGYAVHGWQLGTNRGPREGVEARLRERLAALAARHGRKVSVIGWSLGGVMARELVRAEPAPARCVITLGSLFGGEPGWTSVGGMYEALCGRSVAEDWPDRDRLRTPPPLPSTAIYTRSDGIVAWQGCLEQESPRSENIEVEASHCGMAVNPAVLFAVADRLAQPEGRWQPFERTGARRLIYRDPQRPVPAMA